jgi:hypothetical protein
MALHGIMQRWQGKIVGAFVGVRDTLYLLPQTVTATGSNSQSGSLAIKRVVTVITTVSASTRGVLLPSPLDQTSGGDTRIVCNTTATGVKVYPNSGGTINGGSTNAAITLAAGKSAIFVAYSGTAWRELLSA